MALFGEIIAGQCQLKLKGNQDSNQLTELPTLKINETNKIKEPYKVNGGFTESEKKSTWREDKRWKKNGKKWKKLIILGNANQTNQLESLNLKMNWEIITYQERQTNHFWKMKYWGCEKKYQKKKRKTNTGARREKSKSDQWGNMGLLIRIPLSGIPEGGNTERK